MNFLLSEAEGRQAGPERRWRFPCPALAGIGTALALAVAVAMAAPVQAQETGIISGQVIQQGSMQPVAAAQVSVVGTGLGMVTAQNGTFRIVNVPAGTQTVRVQRIGFEQQDQEVTVQAGQTVEVNFTMVSAALGLDEIVVTGTAGAARRREVGNTISQLNMEQVREPPSNVDALLQGRVPGMTVMQSSGMAGSGGMIRLRGNVSVAMSNQPLIYVDGVRMRSDGFAKNVPPVGFAGRSGNDVASPLNNINPNDIERIEVIKGAAATTLYGTEAAAGVIQIFTRQGTDGAAIWTAQVDQGVAWMRPFGPDPADRPPSEPAETLAGGTSDFLFINPWLRNAHQQNYSLSVRGGGQNLQYFMSGSLTDNDGVLPLDNEDRKVVRGNFTFSPLEGLQVRWNTSFTQNSISNTPAGNNAHGLTLNAFRRDANYRGEETREAIDPLLNQSITSDLDHLVTGVTITHTFSPNFTNRLTVGYDQAQQNNRNLRPFGFELAPGGILSDGRYRFATLTADYVGTYDFRIRPELRSSFSWGAQSVTVDEESTIAYGEDFPGPGVPVVDAAGQTLGFESRERVVNAGFFFQNLFDFRNKYFLTLGVRVDGNSAFGQDLGLEAYPKASASYVISDEDFWNPDWGQLKLRAAWGESGRAPGAFDAVRTYDPVGWGGQPAFFSQNVGNPNLGPERTAELEFGFDGSFFDDRLGLDFTWFKQETRDALFEVRQIPSLGFLGNQLENVGKMENTGVEVSANFAAIERANLGWDVGLSLSTLNSKVLSLGGAPEFNLGSFGWIVEGQPAPVIRSACITNPEELADPIIEADCIHGPNQPTHIIQGNTTVRLPRGLTLSARGEFQGGHYIYNGPAFNAISRSVRYPDCFEAYRIQETQGNDAVPAKWRPGCINVAEARADFYVNRSDFFKLRELTLQVPVPDQVIPQGSRATLTLSGRNLWRWTHSDWVTLEPEMAGNTGFDTQVRALTEHIPPPASFLASLRVTF
jgi:TonB-dependent starch-binding outer membrane protein SusC